MGKKKDEEQGGGAPEWMVTFSDADRKSVV